MATKTELLQRSSLDTEIKQVMDRAKANSCIPHVDRSTFYEKWNFIRAFQPCWMLSSDDDYPSFPITLALFLIPLIITCAFELPPLWQATTMGYRGLAAEIPLKIAIIAAPTISIISIIFMFVVTFMDPGVVLPVMPNSLRSRIVDPSVKRYTLTIPATGKPYNVKWCITCKIWRPIRTIHCDGCDTCVRRFDHHCPWISKCIGIRNHPMFVLWVFSASAANFIFIYIHFMCFFTLVDIQTWPDILNFWILYPSCPLLTFLQAPLLLFTSYLFCNHMWLALTNQTTNETYKPEYNRTKPFQRTSKWENFCQFLAGAREPSMLYSKDENAVLGGEDIEVTTKVLSTLYVTDAFKKPIAYRTGLQQGYYLFDARLDKVVCERAIHRYFGGPIPDHPATSSAAARPAAAAAAPPRAAPPLMHQQQQQQYAQQQQHRVVSGGANPLLVSSHSQQMGAMMPGGGVSYIMQPQQMYQPNQASKPSNMVYHHQQPVLHHSQQMYHAPVHGGGTFVAPAGAYVQPSFRVPQQQQHHVYHHQQPVRR